MHDEECRNNHLSLSESIASVLLLGLGMFTVSRGIFWIIHPNNTNDSQLYASLDSVMSLSFWGVFFFVGGLFLVLSSWFLPRRHTKKRFAFTLLLGGGISSASYFIVAIAGFGNSINWLTPTQLIILSMTTLMLAFFGGTMLWQKKNMY